MNKILFKSKKSFLILVTLFFFFTKICSQQSQDQTDQKTIVAVMPFTGITYQDFDGPATATGVVEAAFSSRSRFTTVNRANIINLYQEKNIQKNEDFMNGQVADQGKSLGANIIVTGKILTLTAAPVNVSNTNYTTHQTYYTTEYYGTMSISITIIDVATGTTKASNTFTLATAENNSIMGLTGNHYPRTTAALQAVMDMLKPNVLSWINNTVFPVEMKILSVESVNKKKLPETVLIKGGSEIGMEHSKGGYLGMSNTSTDLIVYEKQTVTVDGKNYDRIITIGKIRVKDVQGELSVCEVRDGADKIQAEMNAGKTLYLKVKE